MSACAVAPWPGTAFVLLPCPFCGSKDIDPEGWASKVRAGPACNTCNATADTVEVWNTRDGRDRTESARAMKIIREAAALIEAHARARSVG